MCRTKFTLIELLAVIAIIAMLLSILFPALAKAKERTKDISCKSNERQIGVAFLSYNGDYDYFPPWSMAMHTAGLAATDANWAYMMFDKKYISNSKIYYCPLVADTVPDYSKNYIQTPSNPSWYCYSSYGYNTVGVGDDYYQTNHNPASPANPGKIKNPSSKVLTGDALMKAAPTRPFYVIDSFYANGKLHSRHLGSANILWVDGHVSGFKNAADNIQNSTPSLIKFMIRD
jgi:prepilin-type processing-associated H-X9-DG protein/prepilin-type N-terminal cleavage/methylation domain-containing protein